MMVQYQDLSLSEEGKDGGELFSLLFTLQHTLFEQA